jgi:hypothetical protein
MHYVKPDIQPITLSPPPMILSLLEGEVSPKSYNSELNANIKKKKLKIK